MISWFIPRQDEHVEYVRKVLLVLREQRLYAKFSKCQFWFQKIVFLGRVVSKDGIAVDPAKVEIVIGWARPTTVVEVRSFLGLAEY